VKILAVYLSPSRTPIGAVLYVCFGGGLQVLLAVELNAKHIDWNSRLTTTREKFRRDYADGNSCLIFGPDSTITNPYNPSATPDVLDIVITRDVPTSVAQISCSALSSEHLNLLIGTGCHSSIQHTPDRPNVRHTIWAKFQTHQETQIPLIPELHNGQDIDKCVENLYGAILWALAASISKRAPHGNPCSRIPGGIQDKIYT
jgi:hypothetical protein